jgi:hypothetical protein
MSDSMNLDDARYYSRPLVLAGTAFGCVSFFFDPKELNPKEVEKLGNYLAAVIDDYFQSLDKATISSSYINTLPKQ